MTIAELIDFYQSCGKEMFEPAFLIERVKYFYTADLSRRSCSRFSAGNES